MTHVDVKYNGSCGMFIDEPIHKGYKKFKGLDQLQGNPDQERFTIRVAYCQRQ